MDRLAKQQACQLFIEQEIEKGLKEGKTKYSIGKEIVGLIKKYFEADVKPHTIEQRAHRVEEKILTNVSSEQKEISRDTEPEEKRKPETKIQLEDVAGKIQKGEVSDDDIKEMADAIADVIESGKSAPRVGAKVATAVKQSLKKKWNGKEDKKQNDNFLRLHRLALSFQEGLQFWADGTMRPEGKNEAQYAQGVRMASTSIITNYARLGIDVKNIYETFYEGRNENEGPKRITAGNDKVGRESPFKCKRESENLKRLKHYWLNATPLEKKRFREFIGANGNKKANTENTFFQFANNGFDESYKNFYEEVRKAKYRKWETVSKKTALDHVQYINDLINV